MLSLQALIPIALNSMTLISILMMVALGLAIIFGLMNVINMAHGEFVTVGAYCAALLVGAGGSFWFALLLAPLIGFLLGFLIERSIVQYLYQRPMSTILATWGLSLIIQQSIQLIFGATPYHVSAPIAGSLNIFGESYPAYRLVIIGFSLAIILLAMFIFRRTDFGLDMRAIIQNRDMAEALGINTQRVYSIAFASGAAIAALGGALIAPLTVISAQMGINYLARSFFVVITGGTGSIGGVAAGASLVGGVESVLNYMMPVTVSQALVLVLAIVIIRFRPQGLVSPR